MKLLIDIPEHIYEHAKEGSEDSRDEGEAMRAIANGSQQKVGKWIEESKFMMINLEDARKQYTDLGYPHRNELVLRCTACNKSSIVDETIVYNYCPHCGAKMEEEE